MKELSIKEYCTKYHYDTSYISGRFRLGTWKKLPGIKSVRKLGNNWLITVEENVVLEEKV